MPRWARRARAGVLWWCALFVIWLLLVDTLALPEVIAGLGAATLCLPIVFVVSTHVERRYRIRLQWLAALRQLPTGVLRDTLMVGRALILQLIGRQSMLGEFRLVPFDASPRSGGASDEVDARSWAAFAAAATSVTPNTYVVGIDTARGVALVHQLVPTSSRQARQSVIGTAPSTRIDTPAGEEGSA